MINTKNMNNVYSEKLMPNDTVLAQNVSISSDTYKTGLNNNIAVIGASGAGKTSGFVIPNIENTENSFVVVDTKGNLIKKMEQKLKKKGFQILKLDLNDFNYDEKLIEYNVGYNPFNYVRRDPKTKEYLEQDIAKIAAVISPIGFKDADIFWQQSAQNLFVKIASFILNVFPEEMHTLGTVKELLGVFTLDYITQLNNSRESLTVLRTYEDRCMSEYAERMSKNENGSDRPKVIREFSDSVMELMLNHRNEKAVKELVTLLGSYGTADKTYYSARTILMNYLEPLTYGEMEKFYTNEKQIYFPDMGKEKTAVFLSVSDVDRSKDALINLFYAQILQSLCYSADHDYPDNRLAVPVRIFFDDFATNTLIPDFDKTISVIRSREISVALILQSITQLEGLYGHAKASTIIDSCDHCIYLGGQDVETARYFGNKANKPYSDMLYMDRDSLYLFTRGVMPRMYKRINPYADEECQL